MALHVCVRGIGIRRSKDLRAEIGKCPNSTNERKQMSTKTNFKRIALVAVAALGAGVLSVAPANAAVTSLATADAVQNANVCTVSDSTDTAIVKVGGVVKFTVGGSANADLTGPGEFVQLDNSGVTYASGQAVLAAGSDYVGVRATAVGTIKVTFRDSAAGAAAFVGTITVVASCANGVVSASKSYSRIVTAANAAGATLGAFTTNVDDDAATVTAAGAGYIRAQLADTYGAKLPSTGVVQVTATGDVVIGVNQVDANQTSITAPSVGAAKTWIASGTGFDLSIKVEQDSGAPTVSTVTVSYGGTVVATKTLTFLGKPAKVTYLGGAIGKSTASSNIGTLQFSIVDAAGNPLGGKNVENDATFNAAAIAVTTGITAGSDNTSAVTGKTAALTSAAAAYFTCTTKGGTAQLQAKVAVDAASTEYIYTAPFTVACGGALDTWTASLDKAVYAPGEIATLTISGKDAKGFAVYSALQIGAAVASFGGMEFVTAPTDTDTFSSGAGTKTYSLRVLTTEGSYVGSYKATGATDTAAKTLQYKVAGAAGVSNADVLKAIVSLIASINKQIAALQKALLRR
jgi:hypothetical protein